jgi:stage III sporulation protein AG
VKEKKEGGEGFFSGGRKYILPAAAALGVALLLSGNGTWQLWRTREADTQVTEAQDDELTVYHRALVREMEALCATVDGAGEVHVALSLKGGFSYLYATDSELRQDGAGMEQSGKHYVTVGSGAAEQGILLTRVPPEVSGIGVVCQGGDAAAVRSEIIALLSATYGVGSNRIYVTGGG